MVCGEGLTEFIPIQNYGEYDRVSERGSRPQGSLSAEVSWPLLVLNLQLLLCCCFCVHPCAGSLSVAVAVHVLSPCLWLCLCMY